MAFPLHGHPASCSLQWLLWLAHATRGTGVGLRKQPTIGATRWNKQWAPFRSFRTEQPVEYTQTQEIVGKLEETDRQQAQADLPTDPSRRSFLGKAGAAIAMAASAITLEPM